jgi:hypothetical protein
MEDKKNDQEETNKPERLPYEPPRVISEEAFETLALSCASAAGCEFFPKS